MATTAAATRPRPARAAGPDRFTVLTLTLAAFLAVLALLAWQMRSAPVPRPRPVVVLRRVYETRVVETLIGRSGGGSSITQSVSSSGSSGPVTAGPTTRAS
jgi:hypothetical protein